MGFRWDIEGNGGKWAAQNLQALLQNLSGGTEENHETSLRSVGLRTEICPRGACTYSLL
jgi:hypothetical protein